MWQQKAEKKTATTQTWMKTGFKILKKKTALQMFYTEGYVINDTRERAMGSLKWGPTIP